VFPLEVSLFTSCAECDFGWSSIFTMRICHRQYRKTGLCCSAGHRQCSVHNVMCDYYCRVLLVVRCFGDRVFQNLCGNFVCVRTALR